MHLFIRKLRLFLIAAGGVGFLVSSGGCAGRNIHSELTADTQIMVRQWTLPTHGPFESGDRGNEFSNPLFFENTLIFGSQSEGVVSLYPGLLQTRWVLPIPGGILSEISEDRGVLYFGGGDGFLYAVHAENGRMLWRTDLHNPIVSKPSLSGGRLFITTSDDTVYSFDAGTGKWLWHYRRRTAGAATVLGASAPLVDGAEVLVGLSDGFLVALAVQDGQLKWERRLHQGTKFMDVDAHPVLEGSTLYVPSYDGALYALKRQSGEVLWRFDAGGSKQVVIEEGVLYLPSSDGMIYALQKGSGKVLWKFELDRGSPTEIALNEKYVFAGSSHQYFYVLDKKTGKGLYRFNAGYDSGFYSAPILNPDGKKLYAFSSAGNLYSFSLTPPPRKVRPHGMTDGYRFLD